MSCLLVEQVEFAPVREEGKGMQPESACRQTLRTSFWMQRRAGRGTATGTELTTTQLAVVALQSDDAVGSKTSRVQ